MVESGRLASRQRAFKVVGLTWIVESTFAWLSQKSSLEQRLRVEGPNFGSLHRPGGHPPHAQTARPEVKLFKHPLKHPLIYSYIYQPSVVDTEHAHLAGNSIQAAVGTVSF